MRCGQGILPTPASDLKFPRDVGCFRGVRLRRRDRDDRFPTVESEVPRLGIDLRRLGRLRGHRHLGRRGDVRARPHGPIGGPGRSGRCIRRERRRAGRSRRTARLGRRDGDRSARGGRKLGRRGGGAARIVGLGAGGRSRRGAHRRVGRGRRRAGRHARRRRDDGRSRQVDRGGRRDRRAARGRRPVEPSHAWRALEDPIQRLGGIGSRGGGRCRRWALARTRSAPAAGASAPGPRPGRSTRRRTGRAGAGGLFARRYARDGCS